MCTGFIHTGKDTVFAFNFDTPDGAWHYGVYAQKDAFYVGIRSEGKVMRIHGVNARGQFACLPYMNAPGFGGYREGFPRLDLLAHGYIGGETGYDGLLETVKSGPVVNAPGCCLHGLFGDKEGRMLLVEPGLGFREIAPPYAAISNYPLLADPKDLKEELMIWYGVDRQKTVCRMLEKAGNDLDPAKAMEILKAARQKNGAPTRVSFACSAKSRTLLFALEGDFSRVREISLVPSPGQDGRKR